MWTCNGFLLIVDRRRWWPNNSLQSLDYLLSIPFLTTLEANVSEAYTGYVYMIYQTQCDSIAQCKDNYSTICYENKRRRRRKYPILIVNNSYNLSWQWLKTKQNKTNNMYTLSCIDSEKIWMLSPLYLLRLSTQWPHAYYTYHPQQLLQHKSSWKI